jgi:hypothetical protein
MPYGVVTLHEFERTWREASMASRRLSEQGEEKNDKTVRIVRVLAEMRTGHLSEISQERYLWVSRFDKCPTAKLLKVIG